MKKMLFILLLYPVYLHAAVSEDLTKTSNSWNGAPLPKTQLEHPEVTIKKIIIAPGEKLPWHHHPVINAAYVVSGRLTVTSDKGKYLNFKAGDSFAELVNTSHYGVNPGKKPVELIVFYLGETRQMVTKIDTSPTTEHLVKARPSN